jgi:hypothetical protein
MPRWNGPRLTEEQKKERKREYDRERKAAAKAEREAARQARIEAGEARRSDVRPTQLLAESTKDAPLERPAFTLDIPGPKHGLTIATVMDTQVRDGVPTNHLEYYGMYVADKRPDVLLCIGDWFDFLSLSTYIKDSDLEAQGITYQKDLTAGLNAMGRFLAPIQREKDYRPHMIFLMGNHEDRQTRAINANPRQLSGLMKPLEPQLEGFGWTVYPFLQPVVVGGVAFCHYFPSGVMGRPVTTANALLRKMHMSCVAGHQQGRDIAYGKRGDGQPMTAIISGSFYEHTENYLSPFTNQHWRGTLFMHEVKDGHFDEMWLSTDFLRRRYGRSAA